MAMRLVTGESAGRESLTKNTPTMVLDEMLGINKHLIEQSIIVTSTKASNKLQRVLKQPGPPVK